MKRGIALVALLCASLLSQSSMAEQFVFDGRQLENGFRLNDNVSHTVYEDRQVRDTCYRQEVIDHREECSTSYTQECTDNPRQECTDVPRRECTPITRTECRDTTRRECRDVEHRECTPITRTECSDTTRRECRDVERRECTPITRRECRTENRRVCSPVTRNICGNERVCREVQEQTCRVGADGQRVCVPYTTRRCTDERVCHDVTEQECRDVPENVCRDVPDQVCRTHTEQECTNVPDRVCRQVPDQVCRTTTEQECTNVPDRVCEQVPDQVCRTYNERQCRTVNDPECRQVPHETCSTVPVYGRVPYACTRTERVPVNVVDLAVSANVAVNFREPPANLEVNELLDISLKGEELKLACTTPSNAVLLLAKKTATESAPAPRRKHIEASYDVASVETRAVVSHVSKPISQLTLTPTQVKFVIGHVRAPRFLSLGMQLIKPAVGQAAAVTLFSKELPPEAYRLREIQVPRLNPNGTPMLDAQRRPVTETRSEVIVDLAPLRLSQPVGRAGYKLAVAARLNAKALEGLLNPASLPANPVQRVEQTFNLAR